MEIIGNRKKLEIIKKDDNERILKQQPQLTFNGFINSIQSMIVTP